MQYYCQHREQFGVHTFQYGEPSTVLKKKIAQGTVLCVKSLAHRTVPCVHSIKKFFNSYKNPPEFLRADFLLMYVYYKEIVLNDIGFKIKFLF